MALTQFLTMHGANGGGHTHTRIGDKTNGIYGGSYSISEEVQDQFYDLMYNEVIQGNKLEYLTEKQHETGPIYVDLDLKYNYDCAQRMHDKNWIDDLLCVYLDNLKKIMKIDDKPFKIFVMEKDNVNRVADKNYTKDGIHIIIGVNCPHKLQEKLREMVMNNCVELMKQLPLINDLNAVFDEGLSSGKTNVQLFGCRKPLHEAYKLTYAYEIVMDMRDKEFSMHAYSTELTKQTFLELCVRNTHLHTNFELTQQTKNFLNPETEIQNCDIDFTDCLTDIQKLLRVIGSTRCKEDTNREWTAVGQAIKNETKDEGLNDFVAWTNEFGTKDKQKEAINQYMKYIKYTAPKKDEKSRLTIASLHYWARIDNLPAYRKAFPPNKTDEIILDEETINNFKAIDPIIASPADYDIAEAFNTIYKGLHKCVDKLRKEFYYFDKETKLWNFDIGGTPIRNAISTDFHSVFAKYLKVKMSEGEKLDPNSEEKEQNKKICKSMCELMTRLKKTNDKNNILHEVGDICKDVDFPSTLNKSEYMLPTNDGNILDMRTLMTRERTINDNFSFICNAKIIPYDANDAKFIKVAEYFDALFCNNKQTTDCMIDILKSVFIGRPLRYIYFCIGSGSNGKSLLFKILNKIFGKFMDVISQGVIVEQKGNKSALNTEIEKLDKCRLAYVTELDETDKMNEKVVKQISGGDGINLRTLHTKDQTINPTCNMFVLTNEMFSFNGEAVPTLNRMIICPFNNKFAVDDKFEKSMLEISDYIFTYIMQKGTIRDTFNLSPEMIAEKDKHAKNNTENNLKDYLNERLFDCKNDENNKAIVLNDLRVCFENYCVDKKLKNPLTKNKFTSKMKTFGYDIRESDGKTRLYGKKIVVPTNA